MTIMLKPYDFNRLHRLSATWCRQIIVSGWILLSALLFTHTAAFAQNALSAVIVQQQLSNKRIALVIGNSAYRNTSKLKNPVNDADDLSVVLKGFGFDVITLKNGTRRQMNEKLAEFSQKIEGASAALVYYAGHGAQIRGANYLMPVDASVDTEAAIIDESISLNRVLDELDVGHNRTNIVMLDACRDNPITGKFRSAQRGLSAPSSTPKGTVIVYATDPGNTAADGDGRNGTFTAGLLKAFKGKDLSLDGVLTVASEDVERASQKRQTPYVNGPKMLQKQFHFSGVLTLTSSVAQTESEFWNSIKVSTDVADFEAYSLQYPNGGFKLLAQNAIKRLRSQTLRPNVTPAVTRELDISQKQLSTAMLVYLKDPASINTRKTLADMLVQGNVFAALMLHRIDITELGKSPVQIPQGLLDQAGLEIGRLSQSSDVVALSWLANVYRDGLLGRTKDDSKAFALIKQSADKNYAYAQVVLGSFYFNGKGVAKDEVKAAELFKQAADAGNLDGVLSLGNMYRDGKGVAKDETKAAELFKQAAEGGYSFGVNNLGNMYRFGKGVTKDEAKAAELFKQAADVGNSNGMVNLGNMYRDGKGIIKDEAKAVEFFKQAGEAGNSMGVNNLGNMYSDGKGIAKDEAKAVELYKRAADVGNSYGMYNLAHRYFYGLGGLHLDKAEANRLFRKAAELVAPEKPLHPA